MSENQPPTGATQPAGFYPDNIDTMRFWDGSPWTEHTHALVEIKFMQGREVLALIDCTTEPVA